VVRGLAGVPVQYRRDNVTVTPAAEYIRHVGSGGNRGPCTHPAAGGLPSVRGQLPGSRRVAGRRLLLALRRGAAARPGHAPAGRAPERRWEPACGRAPAIAV